MSVGENVRRIREDAGYTQAWLAEQVGITQAMLCQIERGKKEPSLKVAKWIAEALDCTIDDLFGREEKTA